ncbi:MAG: S-methyl-5'-thioinosine phosphorylase [Bacillota bacterium]
MKIALIGGSGLSVFPWAARLATLAVQTEYGRVELQKGELSGKEFYFLPRHGAGHKIPPHLINYRANMKALADLGVVWVIGTAAVGSLRRVIRPGTIVLLDQFVAFGQTCSQTYFTKEKARVSHIDYTDPYCATLRSLISEAARKECIPLRRKGCYICTDGPRYETAAEVRMFARWGGDVVGMTNGPEAILGRELGLCYAALAVVTNWGAGLSGRLLSHAEVEAMMAARLAQVGKIIGGILAQPDLTKKCRICPGYGTGDKTHLRGFGKSPYLGRTN